MSDRSGLRHILGEDAGAAQSAEDIGAHDGRRGAVLVAGFIIETDLLNIKSVVVEISGCGVFQSHPNLVVDGEACGLIGSVGDRDGQLSRVPLVNR